MKQINTLYLALLAFVVDAGAFAATVFVMPDLVDRLQTTGGMNALLVGGAFLFFCVGVYLFRLLKVTPSGDSRWLSRGAGIALALVFAFVISLAIAWQMGFFASMGLVDTRELGEGGSAAYFVFAPGAWLAFSLLYVLVFAFNVTPRIEPVGLGYAIAALIGLIAADIMLLVLAAQGRAVLSAVGAGAWWAIVAMILLIVLFLPPRLLFVARALGLRSPAAYGVIAIFLLLLGIYATQMAVSLL
jgi:hypothetical protein